MDKNNDLMSIDFLRKLKHCGKEVKIYNKAQLVKPEVISIGDYSQIDDFVWILGGQGIEIGRRCHISAFSSIVGGGKFFMEDYTALCCGCRIITGTDDLSEGKALISSGIPLEFRSVKRSFVRVSKFSALATNVVVFPGVSVGEGTIVGAGSIVNKDLEPWGIYCGRPLRRIGERPKKDVIELAERLEERYR